MAARQKKNRCDCGRRPSAAAALRFAIRFVLECGVLRGIRFIQNVMCGRIYCDWAHVAVIMHASMIRVVVLIDVLSASSRQVRQWSTLRDRIFDSPWHATASCAVVIYL